MPVLSVVSALLASVPSELSPHRHKPPSKSTLSSRVLTSTPPSPVLDSRNSAKTYSDPPPLLSTAFSLMPRSTNPRSTRSSSSEVPLVFPESRSSLPTTSTARSPTSQSIPMRLLPTVLPSRLPSSLAIPRPSQPTRSSFSTLPHYPSVSRPLVAR
jgi:hypothetical protein